MENKIFKVQKRDGDIVEFEETKIRNAIFKAITATGQGDGQKTKKISDRVIQILNRRFKKGEVPQIEQIQDIIEEVLILEGLVETAKAYILYREQRRKIREAVAVSEEATERVDQYLEKLDWEVKENANMTFSLQGLNQYGVSGIVKKYWLNKIYPKEIREANESGDLHLHNLDTLAVYCSGWDLYDLLLKGFGGVPGKMSSKPAKHFRSALGQAVNFLFTITGEVAGAVSFSNFDTLLAPFIRYDNLNYQQTKQALQEFLFNMATPTRVGFQNPFSNLTLDLKPSSVFAKQPILVGGKPQKETYAEFEEEMKIFNKAFYEAMLEGDKDSRPFSVDGDCLCPIKNSGKIRLVKIGEYIDKLMEEKKPIFIKRNNCQFSDIRDLNIKCLGLKEGRVDWQKVNFLIRHPEENLLRIWTVGGFNIKVTPSHSVLILKDGEIQSFEAGEIKKGDYLMAPKNIPQGENKISELSLAKEFIKKRKEQGIYIREVFKENRQRLWQKRSYKNTIGHVLAFPLGWIKDRLNDLDLSKAKINLAGSNLRISNNFPITKELVEFLGWYCAEGSAEKNKKYGGISLGFNLKKEKKLAYHIGNLVKKIWPEVSPIFREIKERSLIEVRIHSKLIRKIITEVFEIENKKGKRVPQIIFELPPEKKKIFLDAYFKGDAKITDEEIAVSSISRELIYGVSTLLKQLGIFHTLTEYYGKGYKKGNLHWRVNIWQNRELEPKDSYTISKIPIKESGLEKIVERILEKEVEYYDSLGRKYTNTKKRIFDKFGINNIASLSTSLEKAKNLISYAQRLEIEIPPALKEMEKGELLFFKVKKIKETKSSQGMVYDFSTESENFVADQILVHNSFPIPTINITRDFPWDEPAFDGIFEASAKYGINYFSNYINSDMSPDDVRSMCCRLRLDLRELYNRGGGGLFGSGSNTGSIGVVTCNLPRIGYLSKTKKEFFQKLGKIMDLAKESLEIKRKTIENFIEKGLYPYSRVYLQGTKKMRGSYYANHFATIGLVGMNEALLNFIGDNIASKRGRRFAIEILDFMREKLVKYQKETGNIYNLEATPAESTAYRLAQKDKEKYPDIITAGTKKVPYYSNSTMLPVNYTDDIFEALKLQDEIQCKYTGGVVLHLFLGERVSNTQTVKSLIKKIFEKFHLPYITLTPTFSICPAHGYLSGEHFECPKCAIKQPCEVYSRIVGYLRPLTQWNAGKDQEFRERKEFKIKQL